MPASSNLNSWARVGAEVRLKEIEAELASIYKAFPGLRRRGAGKAFTPGKRQFSARGKAAISEGMRKYWAKRKANAAKAAKGGL
jgi:hypothetical protein